MDCTNLKDKLVSNEFIHWKVSNLRKVKTKKVNWLPLFDMPSNDLGLSVGLDNEGAWVHESLDGVVKFDDEEILIMLLPFLEIDHDDFCRFVELRIKEKGQPIEISKCFPVEKIIICGLKSQMDYWAILAIKWLKQVPLTKIMGKPLLELREAKWASQKVKQDAALLYQKWTLIHDYF